MRKYILIAVVVIVGMALGAYVYTQKKQTTSLISKQSGFMYIESSAFRRNEKLPALYTCDGKGINPPLQFSGIPAGAKSLALVFDDPDATIGTFDHWIVWNIPVETKDIAEGQIPPGVVGTNSYGKQNYGEPCPPTGEHRYTFKLYALDVVLELSAQSQKADLEKAMKGHILDSAELIGLYY